MYIRQFLVDHGDDLQTQAQTCLVILPNNPFFDWMYETVIRDVLEETDLEVTCYRSSQVFDVGMTSTDAIANTARCEFVIADVTDRDEEVLYHLGQALVFHDELLVLTQNDWDLPFNFSQYPFVKYAPNADSITQLKRDLAARFAAVLEVPTPELPAILDVPAYKAPQSGASSVDTAPSSGGFGTDANTEDLGNLNEPSTVENPFEESGGAIPGWGQDENTEILGGGEGGGEGTINVDAAIKRGHEYKTLGMYKEALIEFHKVIDVKPDSAKMWLSLGEVYEQLGQIDQAIEAYTKCIELDESNYSAFCGLGIAYARKGMHYEAINAYADAIRLNPDDASVLSNLGASYNALQMIDDALEAYEQALKLKPNSPKIHLNLGNAYFNKQMYPEAIEAYEQALSIDPNYTKAQRNMEKAIKRMQT